MGTRRVVFIGAGKVAWHLSYALHNNGYMISGIASRRNISARKLAKEFDTDWTTEPDECAQNADIIFITTPDAQIKNTAESLCSKKP